MLTSLTISAHNSLPACQVSRLLASALVLAAAALTGCNTNQTSMHADLSNCLGHSHTWLDAADSSKTAISLTHSRHRAHTRELYRADISSHHSNKRVL